MKDKTEVIVLGGGCFWCTETIFKRLRGVVSVTPGYAGGTFKNPSYYDVVGGNTGHVEAIKIEYDSTIIPTRDLLDIFWHTHNPTTLNRQGADVGEEYRSIILYTTDEQKSIAEKLKKELDKAEYNNSIVTEIKSLDVFYEAEDYHKDFYEKNQNSPYCLFVIDPKLQQLRQKYAKRLKEEDTSN